MAAWALAWPWSAARTIPAHRLSVVLRNAPAVSVEATEGGLSPSIALFGGPRGASARPSASSWETPPAVGVQHTQAVLGVGVALLGRRM